jgi:hypothetical protein
MDKPRGNTLKNRRVNILTFSNRFFVLKQSEQFTIMPEVNLRLITFWFNLFTYQTQNNKIYFPLKVYFIILCP